MPLQCLITIRVFLDQGFTLLISLDAFCLSCSLAKLRKIGNVESVRELSEEFEVYAIVFNLAEVHVPFLDFDFNLEISM
jgi:hypothetical protein